jgi:hypothetical protein
MGKFILSNSEKEKVRVFYFDTYRLPKKLCKFYIVNSSE